MKYDYKKAELFYTRHKGATLKSCSERYSIPFSSLSKKATQDEWAKKKKKYWEKIANEAKERSAEADINKLASIARASESAAGILERALNSPEQFYEHLIQVSNEGGGVDTVERSFNKLDSKSLREVVATLKDLVSVIRNVDELPTAGERQARRIQAERWEMERKRIEAELNEADGGHAVAVRFESDAEVMSE